MIKIKVENLNLVLHKKTILKDVNMSVESGEICGLIGRNGSGKTMLMKCICGFIPGFEGTIKVNEKEIGKERDFPENVGIIIETPMFVPYYSGYKNLKLLAGLKNVIGKNDILETLKIVDLYDVRNQAVHRYSLGMRQRLGIAQAIMENPDILILDEPMNGLDKEGVEDIRKILLELKQQGKTILIASHNPMDISVLCNKIYEMDKGKISVVK